MPRFELNVRPDSELGKRKALESEVERLTEIERCARGLILTAHPEVGKHEVVRQWWDALVRATSDEPEPEWGPDSPGYDEMGQ